MPVASRPSNPTSPLPPKNPANGSGKSKILVTNNMNNITIKGTYNIDNIKERIARIFDQRGSLIKSYNIKKRLKTKSNTILFILGLKNSFQSIFFHKKFIYLYVFVIY